jgi:hypothetical protein
MAVALVRFRGARRLAHLNHLEAPQPPASSLANSSSDSSIAVCAASDTGPRVKNPWISPSNRPTSVRTRLGQPLGVRLALVAERVVLRGDHHYRRQSGQVGGAQRGQPRVGGFPSLDGPASYRRVGALRMRRICQLAFTDRGSSPTCLGPSETGGCPAPTPRGGLWRCGRGHAGKVPVATGRSQREDDGVGGVCRPRGPCDGHTPLP